MAEEIKFLDKTGLTQVISHLQQDTDEKIATAIENAIFAGGSDENVDNLPYLDAEKLNGYTSDDFVKVADLGTTTVGLATADAEGNVISETYAKNSDVNSNFTNLQSQIDTKVDKTTTVNGKALSTDITITAADVGADAQGAAADALKEAKEYNDTAYANANLYTDTAIANLINGAPTTLDTLKEIADAMAENDEVIAALDTAIGTKANQNELDGHTGNTTIHITADERTNWNSKAPGVHTHIKSQITDFPTSMPASDVYSWAKASTKPSYTKAEVGLGNVDNTADSAKSVKYATSAGSATSATTSTVAAKLGANGNVNAPMTFIWSGQSGQPTWLWGGDAYENMYPYNPANFSVNYANSAGTISNQGSAATKDIVTTTTDPGTGAASSYKEGSIICVYE